MESPEKKRVLNHNFVQTTIVNGTLWVLDSSLITHFLGLLNTEQNLKLVAIKIRINVRDDIFRTKDNAGYHGECDLTTPKNHQIATLMSSLKSNESTGSQNFTA